MFVVVGVLWVCGCRGAVCLWLYGLCVFVVVGVLCVCGCMGAVCLWL